MTLCAQSSSLLVNRIGEADFSETLVDSFLGLQPFENALLIAFDAKDESPACLAARHSKAEAEVATACFLDQHFNLFRDIVNQPAMLFGQPIIDWYKQDSNHNSAYMEDLYKRPGISHELAMVDQVDGVYFYLGLFRANKGMPFSAAEARRVAEFWPLALSCIIKHARISHMLHPWHTESDHIVALRNCFLQYGLSRREAEICSHIITGYSSVAMSLLMGISLNTVSTLRQRAYRKLEISSQNELYSLYLKNIAGNLHKPGVDRRIFS